VQQQSRRIVVVRHARAEHSAATDEERELLEQGREDAAEAGSWLAGRGIRPGHVLVSAAVRTRQTWEALAGAAGWGVEAEVDRGLYSAGPETALDLMRLTPEEAGTLVVVGHNPTIAYLAQLLDDGEGDPDASNEMATGYPAGAVTVMEYDGAWADLDAGTARVTHFHVGRGRGSS
jgi:phosphohistidine phosphatase